MGIAVHKIVNKISHVSPFYSSKSWCTRYTGMHEEYIMTPYKSISVDQYVPDEIDQVVDLLTARMGGNVAIMEILDHKQYGANDGLAIHL